MEAMNADRSPFEVKIFNDANEYYESILNENKKKDLLKRGCSNIKENCKSSSTRNVIKVCVKQDYGKPKKRPGPKSKTQVTENLPSSTHSPLKLTIKRLPTCLEPAFEVVSKKKRKVQDSTRMDEMIQEGRGDAHTPSPTPSDILRSEVNADSDRSSWENLAYSFGFLAPEPLEGAQEATELVNGKDNMEGEGKEDSGTSSNGDPELQPPSEPELPLADERPLENGTSEPDTPKQNEQESSDSGCDNDFTDTEKRTEPTPPPNPSPIGGLTILAPSALNSSITMTNGSLPPEPLDSATVSQTLEEVSRPILPSGVSLTVKTPAALGVTGDPAVNLLNINAGSDPLGLMRPFVPDTASPFMMETCEVCGERSDNLEQHRAAMGHYKCHASPDCAAMLFGSSGELTNHQHITHNIVPQQSLQQLQQQVQRLPVPYGIPPAMGTPPPPVTSPYRIPAGVSLSYPGQTSSPVQGTIQPRPFALQTSPSTMRPDGSPVSSPALPAGLGRSISISPSTKPAAKRSTPSPANQEPPKRSRSDSPDCELVDVQQKLPNLPSSISLTPNLPSSISLTPAAPRNADSGVANILASRGITVTPAGNKAPATPPARASVTAQPVTTLNLSSSVSIVPASQARSQFAVPQGRSVNRSPARPPPTVDLTGPDSPRDRRRDRPQRFTCQVCDKVFNSQEMLNQHLVTHRSPGKLPYKCNLCNAAYPTQQAMNQHKQTYHKEAPGSEMALPVVNMQNPATIQKLSNLGIRHCVILSQLTNNSGGVFGLPIVAIDNARNPAVCNLGALGASNVLSMGPAKALR